MQKVNWAHLSFLKGEYDIYDVWQKKNIGTTGKEGAFEIETHDVVLLVMTPVKK